MVYIFEKITYKYYVLVHQLYVNITSSYNY